MISILKSVMNGVKKHNNHDPMKRDFGANPERDIPHLLFYGEVKSINGEIDMSSLPRNVFRVCPENVVAPVAIRTRQVEPNEFTIFRASNGEVLRIIKSSVGITKEDLIKAAKCGKFDAFKAYRSKSFVEQYSIKEADLPIKSNLYLAKPILKVIPARQRTQVFHVCEQTSALPVRRGRPASLPPVTPRPVFSSSAGMSESQKRMVSRAIHGFNLALEEMKKAVGELERLT
jgi:hypothetical protein